MKSLIALMLLSSVTIAAPKNTKQTAAPTWYCFKAKDSNAQTVEGCSRSEVICNEEITENELGNDVHCFGADKAAVFLVAHKKGWRVDIFAFPDMKACEYSCRTMLNEDLELVSSCKTIP